MTAAGNQGSNFEKTILPEGRLEWGEDAFLRRKVRKILRNLGVPEHLSGYHYLVEAAIMTIGNQSCLRKVTTLIYPRIGQKYQISGAAVERAMRYAVESGCMRCDPDVLVAYFGNTIDPVKGKPSNSEFIARVAGAVCQEV